MSDEKQNPAETEEATPEEAVTTESTDLPGGAVRAEPEGRPDAQPAENLVGVADEWKTVSLSFEVTVFGGASYWNTWRKDAGEKIRLDDHGKEHMLQLSSLSGFNLSGMDLSKYDLKGKDLSEANFTGSVLKGADIHWFRYAAGKI